MTTVTGAKLITAAALFGSAAAIFTMVPFLIVLVRGIMQSNQPNTSGGSILTYVLIAFGVHLIASVGFLATVKILDALNTADPTFLQEKVFPIFWAAADKAQVIALSGAAPGAETDAAYSTLYGAYVIVKNVYTFVPIVVIFFALAYGIFLARKDTYRQDHLTVLIYAIGSAIIAFTLFEAWQGIASPALFLPSGDLNTLIAQQWESILGL
ncbi:MAG: hypothetical protein GXO16_08315 [Epsilonproteobacteria bacterium]|nr:hypothetical protein [Campylobacterota bacterium]